MSDNHIPTYANERIVEEIAQELGISKTQVQDIVSSQFEFTTRIMRMNTMEGVILPYLGKIKVKPERIFGIHTRANKNVRMNTSTPE